MTTYVDVTIRCDEAGCTEQLIFSSTNEGGLNASRAMASARHKGWAVSIRSSKCPTHRAPIRTHEFVPGHAVDTCYAKVGNGHCYRGKDHPTHKGDS